VRPDDRAAKMIETAIARLPQLDPDEIEDLYLGCGEPYDEQGANMARRVAVLAGLDGLPGATVNRFCSSSLLTTRMAMDAIKAGEGDIFISAGVECVSRYADPGGGGAVAERFRNPRFANSEVRSGDLAAANQPWSDPRQDGGLPDIYIGMGQTAENVASLRGITREEQDEFAVRSQQRAERAIAEGFFAREIVPVEAPDGTVVSGDDGPRPGTTYEKVAALRPIFRSDGTVTAGNSCPLNDGAAALIVTGAARGIGQATAKGFAEAGASVWMVGRIDVLFNNVTVNVLSPNAQTRVIESIPDQIPKGLDGQIPLGRFADPREIVPGVLFLASPEAGYVTGVVLPVDGGIAM
jgi:acetyl-CoA C-acetyltransferase